MDNTIHRINHYPLDNNVTHTLNNWALGGERPNESKLFCPRTQHNNFSQRPEPRLLDLESGFQDYCA